MRVSKRGVAFVYNSGIEYIVRSDILKILKGLSGELRPFKGVEGTVEGTVWWVATF